VALQSWELGGLGATMSLITVTPTASCRSR